MKRYEERAGPVGPSRPSRGLKRELLLYVEDDDDNWEVAQLRLGRAFELVRAVSDGEACRLLRRRHAGIDAILMDIELRGSDLNGVELTELLRGNSLPGRTLPAYARDLPTFSKPVIFVTAHGARYTDVKLMLTGADRVIGKPVDFVELQNALGTLMAKRGPS